MKTNLSKKKMFFICGIAILTFVIFDGTPYGNAVTDKMFYKFYEMFIVNRLYCIKAIEKYNDAWLEYIIKEDENSLSGKGSAELGDEWVRQLAAEKVYKRICWLN